MDFVTDARLPEGDPRAVRRPAARWDRLSRDAGIVAWTRAVAGAARDARARSCAKSEHEWRREQCSSTPTASAASSATSPPRSPITRTRRLVGRTSRPSAASFAATSMIQIRCSTRSRDLRGSTRSARDHLRRFRRDRRGAIENLRSEEVLGSRPGAFGAPRHQRARRQLPAPPALPRRRDRRRSPSAPSRRRPTRPAPARRRARASERARATRRPFPRPRPGPGAAPVRARRRRAARERLLVSYPAQGHRRGRPQLPSSLLPCRWRRPSSARRVPAEEVDDLAAVALPARLRQPDRGRAPSTSLSAHREHDRTLIEQRPRTSGARRSPRRPAGRARASTARRAASSGSSLRTTGSSSADASQQLARAAPAGLLVSPQASRPTPAARTATSSATCSREAGRRSRRRRSAISAARPGHAHPPHPPAVPREPPAEGEVLLHGPGEQARLLAIADDEFDRAEARGETGYQLMWRLRPRRAARGPESLARGRAARTRRFTSCPTGDFEVGFGTRYPSDERGRPLAG